MTDHVLEPTHIKLLDPTHVLQARQSGQLPEGAAGPAIPMGVVTHIIFPSGELHELGQPFFVPVNISIEGPEAEA